MHTHAELSPERILQTGLGFWASKTLLSAVEMELFTELAHGPEEISQLSSRLGLHPRSSRDFLDALVALGFLRREGAIYSNAPETDLFLDKHKSGYIGGILEMANSRLYPFWGHLTEGLRTGQPQNESHEDPGKSPFEALYADPARLKTFLAAMSGVSHGSNVAIAQKAPWSRYKTFADLGTAQGDLAVQIACANPHLQGIGLDLPEVGPIFKEYAEVHGVSGRVRFEPANFFTDPLPEVEVFTMGHILHDWNLDEKKELLQKTYAALPEGGAVVVYDAMIDDDRSQNALGLLMSLNMLIETPGGFDYTPSDCIGWMEEAGFHDAYVEPLTGPDSMVVAFK